MKNISSKHNESENAAARGEKSLSDNHLSHDDQSVRLGSKKVSEKGSFKRRPTDVMFRNIKIKEQKEKKPSSGGMGSHRLSELYNFQSNFKH